MKSLIQCIKEFSDVSGLRMNMDKSVLFPLKVCSLTNFCDKQFTKKKKSHTLRSGPVCIKL